MIYDNRVCKWPQMANRLHTHLIGSNTIVQGLVNALASEGSSGKVGEPRLERNKQVEDCDL